MQTYTQQQLLKYLEQLITTSKEIQVQQKCIDAINKRIDALQSDYEITLNTIQQLLLSDLDTQEKSIELFTNNLTDMEKDFLQVIE